MPTEAPTVDELQAAAHAQAEALASYQKQIHAAERMIKLSAAKSDLIAFTQMTMPSPENPDDTELSRYMPAKHHRVIAAALAEVEKGTMPRLIITMPPRAGKTELASKRFIPWLVGKDPYRHVIFATYNEEFACDIGRECREIMKSNLYQQVFPGCTLRRGSAAADRVQTSEGGIASFVGKGGSITGRGADFLLIDDPVKDREEADSKSAREKLWTWFTQVAMTRLMTAGARVVIIMTRWHEDDIIGRLTDPDNECYNKDEARKWKILALPALAVEDDPMGRKPGESLWPERFPIEFLEAARSLDSKGFEALYQGNPSPEDGDFFKKDYVKTYHPGDLPKNLRYYVASDHAVSTKQERDSTVLLPVGIDEDGDIWVMPDVWWRRARTDAVCEGMLALMQKYEPLLWFAENGHISKSILPFLRKMMIEKNVYCAIKEMTPAKDKMTRAQSIQGRMSMGKVHFPAFAPWLETAKQELLKFPSGRHDDFVDALAWIGLGLGQQINASPIKAKQNGPGVGTLAWVKNQVKLDKQFADQLEQGGF